MDELTPGQASQLARNEEVIDRTAEELEELEEALAESVAESLRGRRQQAEQQPARKKKRCAGAGRVRPGGWLASAHMPLRVGEAADVPVGRHQWAMAGSLAAGLPRV
jgi:hypothetical protein